MDLGMENTRMEQLHTQFKSATRCQNLLGDENDQDGASTCIIEETRIEQMQEKLKFVVR